MTDVTDSLSSIRDRFIDLRCTVDSVNSCSKNTCIRGPLINVYLE